VKRWALAVLLVSLVFAMTFSGLWITYSAIALASGAIVCLSFFVSVKNGFLLFTGRISYGLYLIHMAIFGVATKPELRRYYPHSPVMNDVTYLVVGGVLSYAAASLSWSFFESQILHAKKWFGASPPIDLLATQGRGRMVHLVFAADRRRIPLEEETTAHDEA
jgi:peptidoglycan/LPS O-acetylase OafA/YrhL